MAVRVAAALAGFVVCANAGHAQGPADPRAKMILETVLPSMVEIGTGATGGRFQAVGSGIIVDSDGVLLTVHDLNV